MRKIAFGYSTRCNIKCSHCVAVGDAPDNPKMELGRAREIIREMAAAGVDGISFTAGEPFIYFDDLLELVSLCRDLSIYTRIVTNSFWAKNQQQAEQTHKVEVIEEARLLNQEQPCVAQPEQAHACSIPEAGRNHRSQHAQHGAEHVHPVAGQRSDP